MLAHKPQNSCGTASTLSVGEGLAAITATNNGTRAERELTDFTIEACAASGYKKSKRLYFSKDLTADVTAGLAFEFIRDSERLIAPSAGLDHKPIEEVVAELSETKFDLYRFTLATYLGQLPPDTNQLLWYGISGTSTPRETVSKMMKDVMGIAIPWLQLF
jgi:hypothetical protein